MERYDLPEGWEWKRLGDLCEIAIGKTPKRSEPRYWGGDNRWAIIADLNPAKHPETILEIQKAALQYGNIPNEFPDD